MSARSAPGCFLAALALGAAAAAAQPIDDVPPTVTTDSAEYCAHLSNEVSRLESDHLGGPLARSLAAEGNRLCDRGRYHHGVGRLRRALVLMRAAVRDGGR